MVNFNLVQCLKTLAAIEFAVSMQIGDILLIGVYSNLSQEQGTHYDSIPAKYCISSLQPKPYPKGREPQLPMLSKEGLINARSITTIVVQITLIAMSSCTINDALEGHHIPGAIKGVVTGAISAQWPDGLFGSLRNRPIPDSAL